MFKEQESWRSVESNLFSNIHKISVSDVDAEEIEAIHKISVSDVDAEEIEARLWPDNSSSSSKDLRRNQQTSQRGRTIHGADVPEEQVENSDQDQGNRKCEK